MEACLVSYANQFYHACMCLCYLRFSYDGFRYMIEYLSANEQNPMRRMMMEQHMKIIADLRQRRSEVERKVTAKTQNIKQRMADNRHITYTELVELCEEASPYFMEFCQKENRSADEVLFYFHACMHDIFGGFYLTLLQACMYAYKL